MTPRQLIEMLEAENFRPIRVVTNSGKSYDIPVAGFAFVARSTLVIVPMVRPGSPEAADLPRTLAIRNIAAIEPLAEQAA